MRRLVLAMIACVIAGCITTKRPLLSETRLDQSFQKTNEALSIYYYAGFTVDRTSPDQLTLLRRVFGEYVAQQVTLVADPPAKERYVRIYQRASPVQATVMERLSEITFWLIPYYKARVRDTVDYDLYLDTVLVKTYQYEISEKTFVWVLNLPFVWINLLTNDSSDAFEATIHEFIRDARNEGKL